MKNDFFFKKEKLAKDQFVSLKNAVDHLSFNEKGLIAVITQDANTKDVLMQAWMNKVAIYKTIRTGKMTYWSRSRNQYWVKGETSGHFQKLTSMRFDCDGDAILCLVEQTGAACHTGRKDCFYFEVNPEKDSVIITSSTP